MFCLPLIGHSSLKVTPSHTFIFLLLKPITVPINNIMIQAMNSPPCTAKAAEIMSRYRPIAPRPEPTPPTPTAPPTAPTAPSTTTNITPSNSPEITTASSTHSHIPQNIRQSPYLMNVWPHMQARPTRTRKRGRNALAPNSLTKRPRLVPLAPSFPLPVNGFPRTLHQFQVAASAAATIPAGSGLIRLHDHHAEINHSSTSNQQLVTLPLLPSIPILASRKSADHDHHKGKLGIIDLNREADHHQIPEEKDFLQQLQGTTINMSPVFTPRPVRPVCSSIRVGPISHDLDLSLSSNAQIPKRRKKEVEEDIESESQPAVVSDSNNRVRLANSAYMEMVGQPECSWLDSCACKRICGEVMLHFSESASSSLPAVSSNGFSCWVTIEWGSGSRNDACNSVNAFCDVMKLSCESKEYLYAWRFHTASSDIASESSTSRVSTT